MSSVHTVRSPPGSSCLFVYHRRAQVMFCSCKYFCEDQTLGRLMFPISLWFMAHAVASVAQRICHLLWEKKPSRSSGCCLLGRFLRFRLLDDSKRNWGSVNGLFYVSGPTQWLTQSLTHASNTFTLAPAAGPTQVVQTSTVFLLSTWVLTFVFSTLYPPTLHEEKEARKQGLEKS